MTEQKLLVVGAEVTCWGLNERGRIEKIVAEVGPGGADVYHVELKTGRTVQVSRDDLELAENSEEGEKKEGPNENGDGGDGANENEL